MSDITKEEIEQELDQITHVLELMDKNIHDLVSAINKVDKRLASLERKVFNQSMKELPYGPITH